MDINIETKLYVQAELMSRDNTGTKSDKENRLEVIDLLYICVNVLQDSKNTSASWKRWYDESNTKIARLEHNVSLFASLFAVTGVCLLFASVHLIFG